MAVSFKIPATLFSYLSGFLYAVAWFLLIDAQVVSKSGPNPPNEMDFLNWLPSIFAAIGWVGINLVPPENLVPTSDHEHDMRIVWFARIWTFVSMFVLFGSAVAGLAIMIKLLTDQTKVFVFGKIVTMLHPMIAIISAFMFFAGRVFGDKMKCGDQEEDQVFV